jgi:hypothetical protein
MAVPLLQVRTPYLNIACIPVNLAEDTVADVLKRYAYQEVCCLLGTESHVCCPQGIEQQLLALQLEGCNYRLLICSCAHGAVDQELPPETKFSNLPSLKLDKDIFTVKITLVNSLPNVILKSGTSQDMSLQLDFANNTLGELRAKVPFPALPCYLTACRLPRLKMLAPKLFG